MPDSISLNLAKEGAVYDDPMTRDDVFELLNEMVAEFYEIDPSEVNEDFPLDLDTFQVISANWIFNKRVPLRQRIMAITWDRGTTVGLLADGLAGSRGDPTHK